MYWYKPCALLSGGTAARADAIRPYSSDGKLIPFNGQFSYVTFGRILSAPTERV